jgi:hypothetical protein
MGEHFMARLAMHRNISSGHSSTLIESVAESAAPVLLLKVRIAHHLKVFVFPAVRRRSPPGLKLIPFFFGPHVVRATFEVRQ